MELIQKIKELLAKVWDSLKKIWIKIAEFALHLVNWFKNKYAIIVKKHPEAQAIALKIAKSLETGDFNEIDLGITKQSIVKTFYDPTTGEILTDNTEVIEYEDADEELIKAFGNKDMLVLK